MKFTNCKLTSSWLKRYSSLFMDYISSPNPIKIQNWGGGVEYHYLEVLYKHITMNKIINILQAVTLKRKGDNVFSFSKYYLILIDQTFFVIWYQFLVILLLESLLYLNIYVRGMNWKRHLNGCL